VSIGWLLVALGAAVGAPLRYVAGHYLDRHGSLPVGTISANLVGAFLVGLFSGIGLSGTLTALLGTGFCGALTTYSGFAVQSHDRGRRLGSVTALVTLLPALGLCAGGFLLGAQ
jgi:CrcB protein